MGSLLLGHTVWYTQTVLWVIQFLRLYAIFIWFHFYFVFNYGVFICEVCSCYIALTFYHYGTRHYIHFEAGGSRLNAKLTFSPKRH